MTILTIQHTSLVGLLMPDAVSVVSMWLSPNGLKAGIKSNTVGKRNSVFAWVALCVIP